MIKKRGNALSIQGLVWDTTTIHFWKVYRFKALERCVICNIVWLKESLELSEIVFISTLTIQQRITN